MHLGADGDCNAAGASGTVTDSIRYAYSRNSRVNCPCSFIRRRECTECSWNQYCTPGQASPQYFCRCSMQSIAVGSRKCARLGAPAVAITIGVDELQVPLHHTLPPDRNTEQDGCVHVWWLRCFNSAFLDAVGERNERQQILQPESLCRFYLWRRHLEKIAHSVTAMSYHSPAPHLSILPSRRRICAATYTLVTLHLQASSSPCFSACCTAPKQLVPMR